MTESGAAATSAATVVCRVVCACASVKEGVIGNISLDTSIAHTFSSLMQ